MSTKKLLLVTAGLVAAVGSVVVAPGASAAHCTDAGGPGHSDFADHARAQQGPGGHNEGDHRGWSSCEEHSTNLDG